jgi:DNA-binding LacI/PurR family transcriptional regulator
VVDTADDPRPLERPATIFDVATRAGVSHQTVSRVINNDPTVRPHIRGQVDDAIRDLRYRPRAAARRLAGGPARTLGLVTTGAALYGPTSTAFRFNQAAREAGYHVLSAALDIAERAAMRDALDTLVAQDPAAIIVIAADSTAIDALEQVRDAVTVPLVLANASPGRIENSLTVAIDQRAGAAMAVRHLVDTGRTKIAHLAGPSISQEATARREAALAELDRSGLEPADVVEGGWTPSSGYAAAGAFDPSRTDAVFCGNDQMALGVLHAFSERGIRVPEDIAVVGFDDIPEAEHFTPPLTTVRQDFGALGVRVLEGVDGVLRGAPGEDIVLDPELVVRASSDRR